MTKLDLKSMASALAAAHNISDADAEKFLKVVCDVVADALRHDGQVKIKGLGTFKLIGVPEREMVDVNTGERITIEARNRISFSPDAVLRDIINKPFVFFETVVLNEGVVFDDERDTDVAEDDDDQDSDDIVTNEPLSDEPLPAEDSSEVAEPEALPADTASAVETAYEPDNNDSAPEEITQKDDIQPETEAAAEETVIPVEPAEQQAASDECTVEEPSDDTSAAAEDNNQEERAAAETDEPEPTDAVITVEAETPAAEEHTSAEEEPAKHNDTPEAVNKALTDARNVIDDIQTGNYSRHHNTRHRPGFWKRNFLNIFIIIVILVGASAFVYGIYGNEILAYLGIDDNDDVRDAIILSPVSASAVAADSVATDSVKKDSVKSDSVKPKTVAADTLKTKRPAPEKVKKDTKDPAYYASLDARVRTGAYDIVGLDTVIKVRSGQTLKSISRTYLGEGMECYVEVFNGVKSVKEGDSLKIPKLKWKKKRK